MIKKYHEVRDNSHYKGIFRGAAHNICNLRYKTPKEIPVVFPNCSTYDYHFIINQIAKEFEFKFQCLRENIEKFITFSVPINKELDNGKIITYKLKFIDSFRFMSTSISNLVNNLSEIYKKRAKNVRKEKKLNQYAILLDLKNNKLHYKCNKCKKRQLKPIKGLIKKFPNIYQFYNRDINKFVLSLKKGVHP